MCKFFARGVGALRSLVWIVVPGSIPVAPSPSPFLFPAQIPSLTPAPPSGLLASPNTTYFKYFSPPQPLAHSPPPSPIPANPLSLLVCSLSLRVRAACFFSALCLPLSCSLSLASWSIPRLLDSLTVCGPLDAEAKEQAAQRRRWCTTGAD
jgi:hypothetical protein